MATDKPRFTITLPDDIFRDVSEFKRERKISTQSKAIQRLIIMGLQAGGPEEDQKSDESAAVADQFRSLDDYGRRAVRAVLDVEADRMEAEKRRALAPVIDLGTIRHYFSSPAAGSAGFADDDFEDIPRTAEMPVGADFCLTVSGDSMEPLIMDGQMIYISESEPVREGDVGVWYFQSGTYVKQYAPDGEGGIWLLSANPDRQDKNVHIPAVEIPGLVCFGRVMGIKKAPSHR